MCVCCLCVCEERKCVCAYFFIEQSTLHAQCFLPFIVHAKNHWLQSLVACVPPIPPDCSACMCVCVCPYSCLLIVQHVCVWVSLQLSPDCSACMCVCPYSCLLIVQHVCMCVCPYSCLLIVQHVCVCVCPYSCLLIVQHVCVCVCVLTAVFAKTLLLPIADAQPEQSRLRTAQHRQHSQRSG